MRREDLTVSMPWNASNYVPLNAFHPLYEFMLKGRDPGSRLKLMTLDFLRWQDVLQKADNASFLSEMLIEINWWRQARETTESVEFWSFFDFNETLLDELADADLKFVHTSPVVAGVKPYIFHVESFETVFFPWTIEDSFLIKTKADKIARIKKFLLEKLESSLCLAIVSHVPKTLEAFREFFASPKVNAKLYFSPLGFSSAEKPRRASSNRRFLFSSSLHGSMDNLAARGLASVVWFMHKWLEKYPSDEFIFLSRFDDKHLRSLDLPWEVLQAANHKNVFCFTGQYLTSEEYAILLRTCDFILLPSSQLHSASVLQSMGMGVIPVVSDLRELRDYGLDDTNAVILDLSARLSRRSSPAFGPVVELNSMVAQSEDIAQEIVDRLEPLVADPVSVDRISRNGIRLIKDNFSLGWAQRHLEEIIFSSFSAHIPQESELQFILDEWSGKARFGPTSLFAPGLRPVTSADFDRRPHFDTEVDLGMISILGDGLDYYAQPHTALRKGNYFQFLSPDRQLIVPDAFAAWAYPAQWEQVADKAMQWIPRDAALPAITPSRSRLLGRIGARVHRSPRVKATLKAMGLHRVAKKLGYIGFASDAPGIYRAETSGMSRLRNHPRLLRMLSLPGIRKIAARLGIRVGI